MSLYARNHKSDLVRRVQGRLNTKAVTAVSLYKLTVPELRNLLESLPDIDNETRMVIIEVSRILKEKRSKANV